MEQHVAAESSSHSDPDGTVRPVPLDVAPIMLCAGAVGCAAALGGVALGIDGVRWFCAWWLGAALVAIAGAFVIARRQAMQDGEPILVAAGAARDAGPGAPARRRPALQPRARGVRPRRPALVFVLGNAMFYGCAVHAAGFFMPRGMKLFAWLIIACAGFLLFVAGRSPAWAPASTTP